MKEKTVLSIGLEKITEDYLLSIYPDINFEQISDLSKFESLFESIDHEKYLFVGVGPHAKFLSIQELAQGLRSILASKKIFYLSTIKDGFERSDFIKNGFNDAFLVNIDGKLIKEEVIRLVDNSKNLRPIKLIDIEPDTIIDFNVIIFLPINKKYIRYVSAGQKFEKERLDRLLKKDLGVIFIPDDDLKKFYNYSAQRIRKLKGASGISETEKQEKVQASVRNIFANLFDSKATTDFEFGKETINECKNMVSTIISPDGSSTWMDNLLKNLKSLESDLYSHSTNVSIYATLFAMALNLPSPEDFAIAGIFHDLGKDNLQIEILNKKECALLPEERILFEKHTERTLDLLKEKKIIINERIKKMITQHHETIKKTGFPHKPDTNKFLADSQVFAIANKIENMCQIRPGEKKVNLEEALEVIRQSGDYSGDIVRNLQKALVPGDKPS